METTTVLPPKSYQAAVRKIRGIADDLEARCNPQTPREQAALTLTIHRLAAFGTALSQRHRKRIMAPRK